MISGIILAAGTSSRFGAPKQAVDLCGKPLLQYVIDAACSSALDEVIVVLGHASHIVKAATQLCEKARFVVNDSYLDGQSTSVRTGLVAMDPSSEAAAILLGDQPGITAELIDRVLELLRSTSASVIRPIFQDAPGHPVVIRGAASTAAMKATGDAGLRELFNSLDVDEVTLPMTPLNDIDTLDDYEDAMKNLRFLQPPM